MNVQELLITKTKTPEEIADFIKPGMVIMSDIAVGAPKALLEAITKHVLEHKIENITLNGMIDVYEHAAFSDENASDYIHYVSWFTGGYARKRINQGKADIMSGYYRDLPSFVTDYLPADVFVAAVSPMDKHGYFSFGVNGSLSEALLKKAKHIFLEVNENMPRCVHGPLIHISQVEAITNNTMELPTLPPSALDENSITIGNLIADMIPNGATIQLGIGGIPDAVGAALKDKKHLGIHTEMFTSSMVDLLKCGAVDNTLKPIHTGRTITTFAYGSKAIYDYIDDNPSIEVLPANYVNDPAVISQHPNFMSVNAAVEVDFYGQVCAESVGTRHLSGTGGQVDYVRGATSSKGGKSFIAFESTAKGGTVSKIKPILTPGAIVTTSKNDVDYIVTEYGVAKLRGQSLSERTKRLIAIAHPKFREELTYEAKKMNIMI